MPTRRNGCKPGWSKSPPIRSCWSRAQAAWAASGDVYEAYTPDTTAAWQAIARRTGDTPVVALPTKTRRRSWLLRAAAVAGLVLGLVFLVRLFNLTGNPELAEISTGLRQTKQLTLADGTQVWLNENTTLRYDEDLNDSVRAVYLSGEAFFEGGAQRRPTLPHCERRIGGAGAGHLVQRAGPPTGHGGGGDGGE